MERVDWDEAVFNRVLPLFRLTGRNIALMGGAGMGQHAKMSNQILIASTMIGVVESILYARMGGPGYESDSQDLPVLCGLFGYHGVFVFIVNYLLTR